MAHVPKAICGCGFEMVTDKNAVVIEMTAKFGPYYKIYADQVKCSACGIRVLLPASYPVAFAHDKDVFKAVTTAMTGFFSELATKEERQAACTHPEVDDFAQCGVSSCPNYAG